MINEVLRLVTNTTIFQRIVQSVRELSVYNITHGSIAEL